MGDVHLHLCDLDGPEAEAVIAAIASESGIELAELRKAVEPPDPRYPELEVLIEAARKDWTRYGDALVQQLEDMQRRGRLLPLTRDNERALQALFRAHEVRVLATFAGPTFDAHTVEDFIRRGIVDPAVSRESKVELSWRLGRGLDMLEVHRVGRGKRTMASITREALDVELTPQDQAALDYVRRRGAVYMRRPVAQTEADVSRVLTEAEYAAVRGATERAIRRGEGSRKLARDLRDAVQGHPSLQNDMDRVARTELRFAHSHGAYVALKDQAERAGEPDPLVYKFVSPGACQHCRRIWGPPSNPKRYRLSEVEAREAAGGNFRRPAREWGPVVGPIHPNCTEGPLQFWQEDLVDAINEAADEIMAGFNL